MFTSYNANKNTKINDKKYIYKLKHTKQTKNENIHAREKIKYILN